MKSYFSALILITLIGAFTTSCMVHPDPYVRRGRAGGATLGAATGAVIGNNVRGGNSWGGAAVGAAVGGLAGDRRGKTNSMYYRSRPSYRYY